MNDKTVVNKVINKSIEKWGSIDGIVANAGAVRNVNDCEINKDDWDWFFKNNFSGLQLYTIINITFNQK